MNTIEKILAYPIIPVFFHSDVEVAQAVFQASYEGGVRVFELTNRGENALEVFKHLREFADKNCEGLSLGIGTILDARQAMDFIEAGADFIVQPFTGADVAEVCKKHQIPWIPGVMTLTELHTALNLGAEMLKVFPGNILGPAFIKSIRGPLPEIKLMVTGGVEPDEENLKSWFSAGVNAVGMGSQLFKKDINPDEISDTLKEIFKFVNPNRP